MNNTIYIKILTYFWYIIITNYLNKELNEMSLRIRKKYISKEDLEGVKKELENLGLLENDVQDILHIIINKLNVANRNPLNLSSSIKYPTVSSPLMGRSRLTFYNKKEDETKEENKTNTTKWLRYIYLK